MPSRQERRKAERDAAKRPPAKSGAGGAAGAAAARVGVNVIPLGDWTTQAEDPYVGPGGSAVLASHRMSFDSRSRVQSAVNDVASDSRLALRLGAV